MLLIANVFWGCGRFIIANRITFAPVKDIRRLSFTELQTALSGMGEPPFRANQVYEWLWKKGARSFDEMSNLSKSLRHRLRSEFVILPVQENLVQRSQDGTIKLGMRLHDGRLIEGVMIPEATRNTACVSSQVGCSLSCTFCATGMLKRERNLEPAEIYDQVTLLNKHALATTGRPLTNIVYMGMGEPLLNYDNVMESIRLITSPQGLGMAPKRITVSTSGIARTIRRMADEGVAINLALSLHAANDAKRTAIMDINRSNPIDEVMSALAYFYEKTGSKITFEYILLNNFNDSPQDAEALASLCRRFPVFVNIIEFNPVEGIPFKKTTREKREAFVNTLRRKNIPVAVRRSRGKDIDAACGQLANKNRNASIN
ncbi:MAG: 23S rRNA (adenine(2503)-C(2))-methyltransferase RlmN [Chitinophagales bacterium]|nr:23S rRNA (adenine(2503)-C(2))-methyltransferase RlmN [Chitinophagales bacterium]